MCGHRVHRKGFSLTPVKNQGKRKRQKKKRKKAAALASEMSNCWELNPGSTVALLGVEPRIDARCKQNRRCSHTAEPRDSRPHYRIWLSFGSELENVYGTGTYIPWSRCVWQMEAGEASGTHPPNQHSTAQHKMALPSPRLKLRCKSSSPTPRPANLLHHRHELVGVGHPIFPARCVEDRQVELCSSTIFPCHLNSLVLLRKQRFHDKDQLLALVSGLPFCDTAVLQLFCDPLDSPERS